MPASRGPLPAAGAWSPSPRDVRPAWTPGRGSHARRRRCSDEFPPVTAAARPAEQLRPWVRIATRTQGRAGLWAQPASGAALPDAPGPCAWAGGTEGAARLGPTPPPPHHTSRGKHAHHGGEPVAMSHPAPSVPEAPAARRQGRWLYTTPRRWLGGIFASASRIGGEVSVPGGSGQPSCCVVGDAAPLAPTLGDGLPGHRRRSPSQGPGPMTSMVTVHETAGPFSLEAPWRRPVVGGIPGRTTACRTHQPTVPVPDAAR